MKIVEDLKQKIEALKKKLAEKIEKAEKIAGNKEIRLLKKRILEKAIKHKGFSFVEIIQPCLRFNLDMNKIGKLTYKINNGLDMKKAFKLVDKWDYNSTKGKIPLGIFYQKQELILEEKWPQLHELMKKKTSWKK